MPLGSRRSSLARHASAGAHMTVTARSKSAQDEKQVSRIASPAASSKAASASHKVRSTGALLPPHKTTSTANDSGRSAAKKGDGSVGVNNNNTSTTNNITTTTTNNTTNNNNTNNNNTNNTNNNSSSDNNSSQANIVAQVQRVCIGKSFQLVERIGGGAFGSIFAARNTRTDKDVAVKLEVERNKGHSHLYLEYKLYNLLRSSPVTVGVARAYYCGRIDDYVALVMDKLGPSIDELFAHMNNRFSVKTVCMLGIQFLQRIEYLHAHGYVHRDIKSENFVMGIGDTSHIVYLIDFGLSKAYRDAKGYHIPYSSGKSLVGTARYMSIHAHRGEAQSRRDDLESVVYVILYLLRGRLPWQNLKTPQGKLSYSLVCNVKVATTPETLAEGFPSEFASLVRYARGLSFDETPDYAYCTSLLLRVLQIYDETCDFVFNWDPTHVATSPARPATATAAPAAAAATAAAAVAAEADTPAAAVTQTNAVSVQSGANAARVTANADDGRPTTQHSALRTTRTNIGTTDALCSLTLPTTMGSRSFRRTMDTSLDKTQSASGSYSLIMQHDLPQRDAAAGQQRRSSKGDAKLAQQQQQQQYNGMPQQRQQEEQQLQQPQEGEEKEEQQQRLRNSQQRQQHRVLSQHGVQAESRPLRLSDAANTTAPWTEGARHKQEEQQVQLSQQQQQQQQLSKDKSSDASQPQPQQPHLYHLQWETMRPRTSAVGRMNASSSSSSHISSSNSVGSGAVFVANQTMGTMEKMSSDAHMFSEVFGSFLHVVNDTGSANMSPPKVS